MGCRRSLFFFQAEDGIRGLVRSRGLGDVYKRQAWHHVIRVGLCLVLGTFALLAGLDHVVERGLDLLLSLIHI